MHIAQVAPLQVAVPPQRYGGTERCIYNLTESLIDLGHTVTLFASGDSQTSARLIAPIPHAINFAPEIETQAYHTGMLSEVYRQATTFDVIHSHLDYQALSFAAACPTPTVITLHGRLDRPEYQYALRHYRHLNYISISRSQQAQLPDLNWVGTVHHSLDINSFRFYPKTGGYLAFVGRITPDKGPERAIAVAKLAGIPLKIAAKVDANERPYFVERIQPLLDDPLIEFLGEVDEATKRDLMGNALALILPINWPEPFGIVFIEALAGGTPVLTCPLGAVPELLHDGVTGYIRQSTAALAAAALQIKTHISRARCRRYAKEHFDNRRMSNDYLRIYEQVAHVKRSGTSALRTLRTGS